MQGEIYTQEPFRQTGHHEFSVEKLMAEGPENPAVFREGGGRRDCPGQRRLTLP
jgi:hypothetical protein